MSEETIILIPTLLERDPLEKILLDILIGNQSFFTTESMIILAMLDDPNFEIDRDRIIDLCSGEPDSDVDKKARNIVERISNKIEQAGGILKKRTTYQLTASQPNI